MTTLRLGVEERYREFAEGEFAVMAIVNRTPDSFFDQGATFAFDKAIEAADQAVTQGADIIDVGGVKAGEGEPLPVEEEIERTVPFIAALRTMHPRVLISIDTFHEAVARAAVAAGADLINDTWAGWDKGIYAAAADTGAGLVCSHTGGLAPRTIVKKAVYDDVVDQVRRDLVTSAEYAVQRGVRPDGILIDPTHDFGKHTYHSLELTRRLGELAATGWPVLVALSRKDFIGETLDLPPKERLFGTLGATAVSALNGARMFRAHDVRATRELLDMVATIQGSREPKAPMRSL
ncbi:dihydropteroate synthase [Natronoglycomyces albus]|uniref:Dihydropteroate synthase n=2 Tax=Natronoglycomyces albus TaxID=2811108 RepID=A0A895XM23_9ACTN|nr:dihydropteroate synthase [Natronoglycomyces albus]QSB04593.1 dihydropteroate synthase [Natronoglycomyces albus]